MSQGICMVPHIINCLAPVDGTTSANSSGYIHMADNNWVTFLLSYGAVSAVTTHVIVYQSSAATTLSRTAIDVWYRYQLAGTDAMSAVASATGDATTATIEMTSAQAASYLWIIDIDPATMTDGKEYISLVSTGDANNSLLSIAALVWPKHPQAIPVASC